MFNKDRCSRFKSSSGCDLFFLFIPFKLDCFFWVLEKVFSETCQVDFSIFDLRDTLLSFSLASFIRKSNIF